MKVRIVTVEDVQDIGDLLHVVLDHPDIEVHSADCGEDGLALVREIKPALVILDVMMPGMDGWTVYDTIRATPEIARTPVIMLSVMRQLPERRRQFAGSEIDLYMDKPFDAGLLRRRIARMLGRDDLWSPPGAGSHSASADDTGSDA